MADKKKSKTSAHFPSKAEVLEFIRSSDGKVSKREIARAFHIRGQDKIPLKKMLRGLIDDGVLSKDPGKALRPSDELPRVSVIEVTGVDEYGDVVARPQGWTSDDEPPRIFLTPPKHRRGPALGPGNRALARLHRDQDADGFYYRAEIIRVLETGPCTVLGVFHKHAKDDQGQKGKGGGTLTPTDKKLRHDFAIDAGDDGGARNGELVLTEVLGSSGRSGGRSGGRFGGSGRKPLGPKRVRVIERLGDLTEPKSVSLIALHHHGIPMVFPDAVTKEAEKAKAPTLKGRTDLRDIPLVTIDPPDARDHDDAIYAQASTEADNEGGWEIMVAIADVAHFVTPGSAIDREARLRGNSCYFPDRHVPMLPDVLSGGLCSLHEGEDRAAMVCHMTIDRDGKMIRHKFDRTIMRSAASLTYREAQDAIEGNPSDRAGPLLETVIKPLYGAFQALMRAREAREPLDLDLPERRIIIGDDGHIESIDRRERFDAHRVVEEFMIAANVAAAMALEKKNTPCMYRVHEPPAPDKIQALSDFLTDIGLKFSKGEVLHTRLFNRILAKAAKTDHAELVNDLILRSQSQAYYGPVNMGHFGLSLGRYAHFTSPIRRYADLTVHRGLIRALWPKSKLGADGLTDAEIADLDTIGEEISKTERRAMAAERESNDRYLAAYLSERVGEVFTGRISGVQKFGLFISVEPSGADGLIPVATIGDDYYDYDEAAHRLVGRKSRKAYQLGQTLEVRLAEADKFTGGLRFEIMGSQGMPAKPLPRNKRNNTGKTVRRGRHDRKRR